MDNNRNACVAIILAFSIADNEKKVMGKVMDCQT